MKGNNGTFYTLAIVMLTLALYFVFYTRIDCKPTDAGFWIIIALGMSIGVALTRFFRGQKTAENK